MIVRILGEGQRTVPDGELDALNALDADAEAAVERGDGAGFSAALDRLLGHVREVGVPLDDDVLLPSDAVLPAAGSTVDEVRHLFDGDGLVPG